MRNFDESIFKDFNSSDKESFDDIGLDFEEKDKVEFYALADRRPIELNVDYSDFQNHIFFGSAYSAVNFSLSRLLNDYPFDGELKEKTEWRRINSGYENWFFDNFPKQQGYVYLTSGSSPTWIKKQDYEGILNPQTASVTIEAVVQPYLEFNSFCPIFGYSDESANNGINLFIQKNGSGGRDLIFSVISGGVAHNLTSSYDSYISSSHAVAAVWDYDNQKQYVYVDGVVVNTGSVSTISSVNVLGGIAQVGAAYSISETFTGSIDDVRYWRARRKTSLIKRNFYRPVHANQSGALQLYFKFNEPSDFGNKIIDYSGNEFHAELTRSFTVSVNKQSGTLGSWFKDDGDPIYDLTNTRVSGFLAEQRTSGSVYDTFNPSYIFKLVPQTFVDDDDSEDQQRFLLLIARHYDRLKLYMKHLSNLLYSSNDYNTTPNELINLVAKNYGMDLGGVYEGSTALQYLFGEEVLATGSLGSSLNQIRNRLRRNLLNSLSYIVKTKSTRESILATLRSVGLDDNIVEVNEYSIFSGGIQTSETYKNKESRVAKFDTTSNVFVKKSVYSNSGPRSYQIRVLFNTASSELTSSVFSIQNSGIPVFYLNVERENLTSSNAVAKLYHSSATDFVVSSSQLKMYDNNWVNFTLYRDQPSAGNLYGMHVSSFSRNELLYHFSASGDIENGYNPASTNVEVVLGKSGSILFDGYMQEFRAWNKILSASNIIEKHTKDFESLALENFLTEMDDVLLSHLKLNDYTGSVTTGGPIHDWTDGLSGSSYLNFSSSADYNFPGKFIEKREQSYLYDISLNNDKVRVRNISGSISEFDLIQDLNYLSVDISPITSLNKEIVRWFGDLEKFNNIIGYPYLKYRSQVEELNAYRSKFFSERMTNKISFESYLNLIKWFDSNFTFLLKQLIPLDLVSTLSNFVIEPHLFEFNKYEYKFPFSNPDRVTSYTAAITTRPILDANVTGHNISLGDPGRFGSAVSASAKLHKGNFISSSFSSSNGVNFRNLQQRKERDTFFSGGLNNPSAPGYIKGFYSKLMTGSNYLKNVLNVNSLFNISGVHYSGDSITSQYLSSAGGEPAFTSSLSGNFNGVQDQRWLWYYGRQSFGADLGNKDSLMYDFGISYGGGWGQLWKISGKSMVGYFKPPGGSEYATVGFLATASFAQGDGLNYQKLIRGSGYEIKSFYPHENALDGVFITKGNSGIFGGGILKKQIYVPEDVKLSASYGPLIKIEGYRFGNFSIEGFAYGTIPSSSLAASVGPRNVLYVTFQFFNSELGISEDIGSESILSSSLEDLGYTKNFKISKLDVYYEEEREYNQDILAGTVYSLNFNKTFPNAKYMKAKVTFNPLYATAAGFAVPTLHKAKFLVKLHNDEISQQERIRNTALLPNPDLPGNQ